MLVDTSKSTKGNALCLKACLRQRRTWSIPSLGTNDRPRTPIPGTSSTCSILEQHPRKGKGIIEGLGHAGTTFLARGKSFRLGNLSRRSALFLFRLKWRAIGDLIPIVRTEKHTAEADGGNGGFCQGGVGGRSPKRNGGEGHVALVRRAYRSCEGSGECGKVIVGTARRRHPPYRR